MMHQTVHNAQPSILGTIAPYPIGWHDRHPDAHEDWTTEELHREDEVLRWKILDFEDGSATGRYPADAAAVAHHLWDPELRRIARELDKRRRLKDRPGAPPWPIRRDRTALVGAIKDRLNCAAFMERQGMLPQPRGEQLSHLCPLPDHQEQTPSFFIWPDDHWYCFGCRRGGDILDLARLVLNLGTFTATVDALASELGLRTTPATVPHTVPASAVEPSTAIGSMFLPVRARRWPR